MKKSAWFLGLVSALALLCSISVVAVAEGRSVIAEVTTSGGIGGPAFVRSIIVRRDGSVYSVFDNLRLSGMPIGRTTKILARLAVTKTHDLVSAVDSISVGSLLDSAPDRPACFDGPMTSYNVYRKSGEKITVISSRQCKRFVKENSSAVEENIVQLLDGFRALDGLVHVSR